MGAPPALLLGISPACPRALREEFVVLSPQCPVDPAREDGSGVWLRQGFDPSFYDSDKEAALAALIDSVVEECQIDSDRILLTGASMGGFACLELVARWQGFFAAVVPVAAYYELDANPSPSNCDIDALAVRMTETQAVPSWFFHSTNDRHCPYAPMARLVRKLRVWTAAEIHFTSFEDQWSISGHDSECVVYPCVSEEQGQVNLVAMGEEVCAWLLRQHRRPVAAWKCDDCLE